MMILPERADTGQKKGIVMFNLPTGLSEHNDLDQLKRQSKDLLKAFEAKEPTALEVVARHFHEVPPGGLQLTGAQLVIARHHGFDSWAKLRAHVDGVNLKRLVKAIEEGDVSQAKSLLRQRPELVNMPMAENNEHRGLHYAVLRRDVPMVRMLITMGADAHMGIYPHREATSAYILAKERGFSDMVEAIEEEEQFRRQSQSCPNATVSLTQDELNGKIRRGEESAAIAMLEHDPSLARACDREGATPLHIACEEAALQVIDWLLEHQANPRKEDIKGHTPLDRAIRSVHWKARDRRHQFPEIFRRLRSHGAPMSPFIAAALGDLETLSDLYQRSRLSPDETSWAEANILSTAVTFGHFAAIKLLLDLGLDPNERVRLRLEEEVYSSGLPLWLASAFGEHEIAALLLECGANPTANVYASGTPVDRAYGARDERMKKLLAAYGGHPSAGTIGIYREIGAARKLLAGSCDEPVISGLLSSAACGGEPEIVHECLSRLPWAPTDNRWHSIMVQPLRLWIHSPISDHPECYDRSTYPECLRLILAHGVNVNVTGKFGDTLLHCIAAMGNVWTVEVMSTAERLEFARIALAAAPDFTIRDDLLKSTPLAWACRWGRLELVELLLEHGAPAQETEAEPWATPLAWARKANHLKIISLLEDRGATL